MVTREYAGYVWNTAKNTYNQMFQTEISSELARARAIEMARYYNFEAGDRLFDIDKTIVKEREVTTTYGEWKEIKK